MSGTLRGRFALVAIAMCAVTLICGAADAAVTKGAVFACRDAATLTEGVKLRSKGGQGASQGFEDQKIASGECTAVPRNSAVSIDERKGPLLCVRLSGGLDCYWTIAAGVDEYGAPAKPDGPPTGGNRRRR